jgi:mannose-6-phosphate isomerase-like protein (cupin superfamily)
MTVTLESGCRVSDMHDGEPIGNGTLRIWKQIGRASGAQAISLRVMEFAPGRSPGIKNEDCDQILFVCECGPDRRIDRAAVGDSSQGQARSAPPLDHSPLGLPHPEGVQESGRPIEILIDSYAYEVLGNTGVYIRPNETFAIDNPGPDSVTVVSCQCPNPDREPQFVNALTASSGSARRTPSPIVRLADRPAQPTADRWYRVLVDDEVGSMEATQFVGSIPPGRAPDHFHHYEEVLFILKGQGRMWAGETNTPIAPGSCIYLPKGQVHCVENTGTGELRLLGVFYPAGSPSVRYEA